MAGCNQTLSGLINDCAPSMGGIVEVYAASREDVESIVEMDGVVSTITMGATTKFQKYSFKRNTGSMTSTLQVSQENGTRYVSTDLVLSFTRMETAKRIEISALAQNDLVVIVKDANGKYWLLGKDEPVKATAGDGATGTARADKNGYSITLQDNSWEFPFEVDESIVSGLVA